MSTAKYYQCGNQVFWNQLVYKDGRIRVIQTHQILKKFGFPTLVNPLKKPIYRIIKKAKKQTFINEVYESNKDLFFPLTEEEYQKHIDADGSVHREESERCKGGE